MPATATIRLPADSARPDAELRETVERHAAQVRTCYEIEGLKRDPTLRGTLEVELTIRPTGVVDSVQVNDAGSSGAGMPEVSRCVAVAAHNWRFERGAFQTEDVVFPFHLEPDRTVESVSNRQS